MNFSRLFMFSISINVDHVHDHCGHNGCFSVCYNYDNYVCRNFFSTGNHFYKPVLVD